jgi:hypothetical protein
MTETLEQEKLGRGAVVGRNGNRLLAALDNAALSQLLPAFRAVMLEKDQVIYEPGDDVRTTYFPLNHTVVSLRVVTPAGDEVEAATIGREGAIGGLVSAGAKPAFGRMIVQLPGPAVAIATTRLEEAKRRSPAVDDLFARYGDALLAQVMQSVACNALHSVEERAARWLLSAHDRAGDDTFGLSQQALADMLGVQRTTVTTVCASLQAKGAMRYSRARVTIADRRILEKTACACHAAVERHFKVLLPEVEVD